MSKDMMIRTVRWFDHAKGYGFLTASDGEEVFVHHKAIKVKGYRSLKADEEVEFTREKTDTGWSATEVVRVEYPLSQV